jgi:putative signal transducing protein
VKYVYGSSSIVEIGHLKNLLEQAGIGSFVKNAALTGALGELPFFACEPELWVFRDDEAARAAAVIHDALTPAPVHGLAWRCTQCGETNEAQFAACWNCGARDAS